MKISEFILEGKKQLVKASLQCADPLLHMKQIVEYALGLTSAQLYLRWDDTISINDMQKIDRVLNLRLTGKPFQYICGQEWFWNSCFKVGPGVLIPRRETECLVERLLEKAPSSQQKIAELGAGSGNIGISCLLERPTWEWHAFERNPDSLPYLEFNKKNLLPSSAHFQIHPDDFFSSVSQFAPYDWCVANPPYVSQSELAEVSVEVRQEPEMALLGGEQGTEILMRLVEMAPKILKPMGGIVCEIGKGQDKDLEKVLKGYSYQHIEFFKDYSGIPRVLLATVN